MTHTDHTPALERAAAPALAAIEEDSARAPKWLRPLFDGMREHLFDPDLSLEQIQQAADYADAEIWSDLREEVGQAPWTYIRDARLETATHLLIETRISISEIGYLVGYSSPSTFRRPLHSFLGMPPSQYRRQAPRLLARAGTPPTGAGTNVYWERMQAGELSDTEARELDDYLRRLAPASDPAPATGDGAERWTRLRQTLAEGLAEALDVPEDPLPFAEQRRLVRDAVRFPDGTFFEQLSKQSSETGQESPERGIQLALLAIDSLAANQMLETHPGTAALARARLARARWRAGDLLGAEQDLARATRDAATADEDPPTPWRAEHSRVAVAFHWLRGRRLDGLDLAAHMVTEQRAAGTNDSPLVMALLLRAELRAAAAELEPTFAETRTRLLRDALTDVEEASRALGAAPGEQPPPRLRRALISLWARLLVLIGNRGDRLAGLPQIQRAAAGLGEATAFLLCWLEGHGSTNAEPLWRQARAGFTDFGDELWAARTTLDLARLCIAEGRPGEAAALATELAKALGVVAGSPEDLATIKALGRAAPFTEVTDVDLVAAEGVLKRLEWQRRTHRALDLAS